MTECVKDVAVCVTLAGYQVHTSLFVPKSHCDPSKAETSHPKPLIAPRLLLRGGLATMGTDLCLTSREKVKTAGI